MLACSSVRHSHPVPQREGHDPLKIAKQVDAGSSSGSSFNMNFDSARGKERDRLFDCRASVSQRL